MNDTQTQQYELIFNNFIQLYLSFPSTKLFFDWFFIGARPGLGTQPRYEAPGDLRVENVKRSD